MLPQSLQLEQATNAYQAALARYEEVTAPPKADRLAQASAAVKQAQAEFDRLVDPVTASELEEADAAVRQAQAQLDLLQAGPREQGIATAKAAVGQAEAALRQTRAALSETELVSPFKGVLAALSVRQGEQVAPGAPIADVGDVSGWLVETDDLSELDVIRVQAGQIVRLTFDAIPDLQLEGVVLRVQPKGEKKLGDMTYTATIRLEEFDPRLLWNMTAIVSVR
jgi:multidrug resistance efflux pump